MFRSGLRPAAAVGARVGEQKRGMAISLYALRQRIRATNNVAKLTGVMKMVASSKLRNIEARLHRGRPFGRSLLGSIADEKHTTAELETAVDEAAKPGKHHLLVCITTDRGLCGGVNSFVARSIRAQVKKLKAAGETYSFFVVGDKGRMQLARDMKAAFVYSVDGAFDKDPEFALSAEIAKRVIEHKFDSVRLVYNDYESSAKFVTVWRNIASMATFRVGVLPPKFKGYTVEPENNEETLQNLMEYGIAGSIHYALLESAACEMSSRMIAMDNATTNASDMVSSMQLKYNRARQAKITTELIEIISGAESIKNAAVEQ